MSAVSPVDVYRKVTIGVAGTAMPQFEETLAREDRWAVATYVARRRAGSGEEREGEGRYAAPCASCHGATGGGDGPLAASLSVQPPALRDLAIQGRFSDDELIELILHGRPGTPMPGFAQALDRASAAKLVAFLRVLPTAERQRHEATSPAAATFEAVRRQVDSAVALRSGPLAFDAYLTFEQVETAVRARNAGLASELEDAFAALRTRATGGAGRGELDAIHARLLSGVQGAGGVGAGQGAGANMFIGVFVLAFREGVSGVPILGCL